MKGKLIQTEAVVMSFGSSTVSLYLPEYDIDKELILNEIESCKSKKISGEKDKRVLQLELYTNQEKTESKVIEMCILQTIKVCLTSTDSVPIEFKIDINI